MRALAERIRQFSDECRQIQGHVAPGATLEIDDLDRLINILDDALVAIRTLDTEVYQPSDPGYETVRATDPQGQVVRALTPPRDSAVHHADVVDPDLARAVGPIDGNRFIIFPKWKPTSDLPQRMFEYFSGKEAGQINLQRMARHNTVLAGRLVLDTLLDAFAFFDRCDPTVADRDADGDLIGFPLPPLPIGGTYFRLAPDWPDHVTVDRNLRVKLASGLPTGEQREIMGYVDTAAGRVWCGYTAVTPSRGAAFTEVEAQVIADLDGGYRYVVGSANGQLEVRHVAGDVVAGTRKLSELDVTDWTNDHGEPWAGWWELCTSDAAYYRDQRRST